MLVREEVYITARKCSGIDFDFAISLIKQLLEPYYAFWLLVGQYYKAALTVIEQVFAYTYNVLYLTSSHEKFVGFPLTLIT